MMSSVKVPEAPLTQVVFVHDYIQLVFQDDCFSIYNTAELKQDGNSLLRGQFGFCDALVSLIGLPLTSVSSQPLLSLRFQGGAEFIVTEAFSGPEAWQYSSPSSQTVVAQNA